MVFDHLAHASQYERLGPRFALAIRFLQTTELSGLAPGCHQIDGDNVRALVEEYDTKFEWEGRWEAHQMHADIQCLAYGEERIGHALLPDVRPGPYDPETDRLFAECSGSFLTLMPGRLMIFFPHDVHMPGVSVSAPRPVKKIVVKIRLD